MSVTADTRTAPWRRRLLVYGVGLMFTAFAVASLVLVVLRVPPQVGEISLAGERLRIAVALTPDPPRIGAILVEVILTDESGNPTVADEIVVGYGMDGRQGREAPARPLASDGLYRGRVDFPEVGSAWVEVGVRRGDSWARVRFLVEVRPNM
ncbi:MAG: hypothetical protein ACRDGN_11290 [bacterium]